MDLVSQRSRAGGRSRGATARRNHPADRGVALRILALFLLAAWSAAQAPAPSGPAPTFFVAPDGDDSWSGRLARPAADGGDGPFATPARAHEAVRERLAAGAPAEPLIVELGGGVYELEETLVFEPGDSGSANAPVVWRARPGERPVLSGGRRVTGWSVEPDGAWRAELPATRAGSWRFAQLWVQDQRRFRPRVPARGWLRVAEQLEPSAAAGGRGHDRLGYAEGDFDSDWDLAAVELMAIHIWSASRMRVAEVQPEARALRFTGATRTTRRWGAFQAGNRYFIDNVAQALDEPGEWFLDREAGELTYLPRAGERPDEARVVAPRLATLVRLEGDLGARRFVEHLRFEGLDFAHAGWSLPPAGQSYPQAEARLGAAIEALGARGVRFSGCAVRHVGRYGVAFGPGCRDATLQACELFDLGAGGVQIGLGAGSEAWAPGSFDATDPEAAVERVSVVDCTIRHGGRLHPAAVGVWIGHASHCRVLHNEIADLYYSGVSVGWTWGYAEPSRAHHNEVAHNLIADIGQGLLSDMAGVYTLGLSPGTRVHHNRIQDVLAHDYGGWGLYTDEGSTGISMTHNLVLRTKTGGFHQHYGRDNRIANNIFVEAAVQQLQRTRTEQHLSFELVGNIVYWTNASPLLGSNWADDGFRLDKNLYWNPEHPELRFPGELDLAAWRERRHQDLGSRIADPRFVDPAGADFRLQAGSPALDLGFEPWDLEAVGPRVEARLTGDLPPVPPGFE